MTENRSTVKSNRERCVEKLIIVRMKFTVEKYLKSFMRRRSESTETYSIKINDRWLTQILRMFGLSRIRARAHKNILACYMAIICFVIWETLILNPAQHKWMGRQTACELDNSQSNRAHFDDTKSHSTHIACDVLTRLSHTAGWLIIETRPTMNELTSHVCDKLNACCAALNN